MWGHCWLPRRGIGLAAALMALGAIGAPLLADAASAPAQAAVVPGADGAFGLGPAPGAGGRAQPYFMLTLPAGGAATAVVLVTNYGGTTEKLKIGRAAGVTAVNGGSAFRGAFQPCSGPGCWLTRLPPVVTLPGGSEEALGFRVHVPAGTRPGQYLAGITGELATAPKPVRLGQRGPKATQAIIIRQVTVAVAVNVGSQAALTTRMQITRVVGSTIGGSLPRLTIMLANTGQTFARAAGSATCTGTGKQQAYRVFADTVLPGDQAAIAANAIGLPEGATAQCTVRLTYGRGQVASWNGPVTIPGGVRAHEVSVGPGDYAVLPDGGIPAWAIALMVLGALLLAGMTVLMLRMRRVARKAPADRVVP